MMSDEELFEFKQFKQAAFEGNTSDAMLAVHRLAKLEQVNELDVLIVCHLLSTKILKFQSLLIFCLVI